MTTDTDGDAAESTGARRWHDHNWEEVLAGQGTADHYFVRSGLVRKDRLANFAPPGRHPPTVALRSFAELQDALQELGCAAGGAARADSTAVRYVLKQAHSSNASGIRFLSEAEAIDIVTCDSVRKVASSVSSLADHGDHGALVGMTLAMTAFALGRSVHRDASLRAKHSGHIMACLALAGGVILRTCFRSFSDATTESVSNTSREVHAVLRPPPDGARPTVWVLQRVVRPYLHTGRKFHLRVLLLCVGDLSAYVYTDVRMLLATEPYDQGQGDSSRLDAHVTNMGASRAVPGYSESKQNCSLQELGQVCADKIMAEIKEILSLTISRVRAAGRRHFFTVPNCWELFGVDFLVQAPQGRAVLLEVNPSPSLAMYGGASLRDLVGPDPLQAVPEGWMPVPLSSAASS